MSSSAAPAAPPDAAGPAWLAASVAPLLYGLRLATAVCLALFIAFTLELDKPSWAGGSAAIVCQPILGSSLRKGFFRMIGTVVGATVAVVLTGLFPQNRAGFLVGMALWAAFCAFGGTLTRNFAAYAFALSGYTLAIIAGDSISSPDQVFHLAISRASEIIIGIVCATMVTGLSDLGQSPRRLAGTIDRLGREILFHFSELLWNPCDRLPEGPALRRDLIGRVAALDLSIDQAIGESPELRHRKAILWAAMSGLFAAQRRFLLGRRLFRGNHHRAHPRGRPGPHLAARLSSGDRRPRRLDRARHRGVQRHAGAEWPRHREPDLHLGPPRPARAGPGAHRPCPAGREARGRHDRDGRDRPRSRRREPPRGGSGDVVRRGRAERRPAWGIAERPDRPDAVPALRTTRRGTHCRSLPCERPLASCVPDPVRGMSRAHPGRFTAK